MRLAILVEVACFLAFLVLLGLKLDGQSFSWVWAVIPLGIALITQVALIFAILRTPKRDTTFRLIPPGRWRR